MSKKIKKVTLESLTSTVEAGFKRMGIGFKETKQDNESLAGIVADGFENANKEISEAKNSIGILEQGQENIQLRLVHLALNLKLKS